MLNVNSKFVPLIKVSIELLKNDIFVVCFYCKKAAVKIFLFQFHIFKNCQSHDIILKNVDTNSETAEFSFFCTEATKNSPTLWYTRTFDFPSLFYKSKHLRD